MKVSINNIRKVISWSRAFLLSHYLQQRNIKDAFKN